MKINFPLRRSRQRSRKGSAVYILIVLFLSVCATLLIENYYEKNQQTKGQELVAKQLISLSHSLQMSFNDIVENNENMAKLLEKNPIGFSNPEQAGFLKQVEDYGRDLMTISFATDLQIKFLYPVNGNESAIGTDYRYRPEFMRAIRRAIENRETVITSSVPLIQTNKSGVIIRSPIFEENEYIGLVSSIIELDMLLNEVGYKPENYQLLIQAQTKSRGQYMVMGEFHDFVELNVGKSINLPEETIWEIRAKPLPVAATGFDRISQIRLISVILTSLIVIIMLRRRLVTKGLVFTRKGVALRTILLSLLMMPIVLLIILSEVFYLSTLKSNSDKHLELMGNTQMRQTLRQVESFFDVPKQAIHAIVLFQQGVINLDNPMDFLSFFVAQMRVQPQLTFLSVANVDGEYYAVSRPPTGDDRNLRMQWATIETDRQMRIHWANDSNLPSDFFLPGNENFDARTKGWYQKAKEQGYMQWYPAYRYTTDDNRKQYSALGIGVSAP